MEFASPSGHQMGIKGDRPYGQVLGEGGPCRGAPPLSSTLPLFVVLLNKPFPPSFPERGRGFLLVAPDAAPSQRSGVRDRESATGDGRLLRLDGECVEAGCELGRQRLVDQAVFRQPRESGELFRAYTDRIMRLAAGRCAGMAMVKMRLVHYLQQAR